ncbi:MAG: ribosome maturation factor RimM [Proteobacteria bacterium]|nr:ribosome maturation factor RimM [Pseudomonadota bacterium]
MGAPGSADEPAWPADAVEVGRVADAWGVKGWIKVASFAADPQALLGARRWFARRPDDGPLPRPGSAPFPSLLRIVNVRRQGDGLVAQVHGIEDRNGAEALRGARLFVPRSSFPSAGTDEYYWIDLVGLAVANRRGEALGSVVGLIDTGPQSVLRVAPRPDAPAAEERLIPFVAAYVDDVDLAARRIVVDWELDY